ncbi:MAG: hypothetical protein GXO79_01745 [Chlorobi bacterium]|nr:hypothetical protein [Chlorobiota bacterium]
MNTNIKIKEKISFSNPGFLKSLQILSIDVVAGSLSSGLMVTKLVDVKPGFSWWIILAISVWLIYTVDHLADGLKLGYSTSSKRYLFHYHHRKKFIIFIILFGIIASVITFFWLDYRIVYFGLFLGVLVLIYLIINVITTNFSFFLFPKEIIIAIFYTLGIWGGPLALINYSVSFSVLSIMILFGLAALSNLFIFSYFEMEKDIKNKQKSVAILTGEKLLLKIIYILGFLVVLSSLLLIVFTELNKINVLAILILISMQLLLLLIVYRKNYFEVNERYRLLGDAVFLLPLFMILA